MNFISRNFKHAFFENAGALDPLVRSSIRKNCHFSLNMINESGKICDIDPMTRDKTYKLNLEARERMVHPAELYAALAKIILPSEKFDPARIQITHPSPAVANYFYGPAFILQTMTVGAEIFVVAITTKVKDISPLFFTLQKYLFENFYLEESRTGISTCDITLIHEKVGLEYYSFNLAIKSLN